MHTRSGLTYNNTDVEETISERNIILNSQQSSAMEERSKSTMRQVHK